MKVLFFARRTLHRQPGGDRVHLLETMRAIEGQGHEVALVLEESELKKRLAQESWDVLHSFNMGRLADQYPCYAARKANPRLKWAISTVWVDYSAYDGDRSWMLRILPAEWREFAKLIGRALFSQDRWPAWHLLWMTHPIKQIAWAADILFCSTEIEAQRVRQATGLGASVHVVAPGTDHFELAPPVAFRKDWVVLGRIEGLKNQIAAVEAWIQLKGRGFHEGLRIIGDAAPNHGRYVRALKKTIARAKSLGVNITWEAGVPAEQVPSILAASRGVLIPSLFETFGLSALEGLRAGNHVVLSSAAESATLLAPWVYLASPKPSHLADAVLLAQNQSKELLPSDTFRWKQAGTEVLAGYAQSGHFIAFTGSRGMPNRYGGYEEMVDHVGRGLADLGHRVWISTSSAHPDRDFHYPGIQRTRHCDPESWMGSAGQFVYDWRSLRALKPWKPDAHIALGTTSSGPWLRWKFWRGSSPLAVHMDGLEWMRGKYSPAVRSYLRRAEAWAARGAHILVSDNPGIRAHIEQYGLPVAEIAYGVETPSELTNEEMTGVLSRAGLTAGTYALVLCRLVPENNVDLTLDALLDEGPVAVLGNWSNAHADTLLKLFSSHPNFIQLNANFDPDFTQALRQGCRLYVHGHSAGGTNPGLLQAMAAGCRIAAHDNVFNRAVLGSTAGYFSTPQELRQLWPQAGHLPTFEDLAKKYSWEAVTAAYADLANDLKG